MSDWNDDEVDDRLDELKRDRTVDELTQNVAVAAQNLDTANENLASAENAINKAREDLKITQEYKTKAKAALTDAITELNIRLANTYSVWARKTTE